MKLSQGDRSALISRVEQRLGGRAVSRAAIASAVDQVLAGLPVPDESPVQNQVFFALSAESMPDLASRVKQRLSASGIEPTDSGTATAGRFTVMTLRASSASRAVLDDVARGLGATLTVVDDQGPAGATR
jgi:hypothetical protein